MHVQLNDGLDRRITTSYKATEYMFRELKMNAIEQASIAKKCGIRF